MKAQVAHYQFRTFCLRIEPVNGTPIRIAQYPVDLVMTNGDVYESTVGYNFTGYSSTDSFSPSVVDLEGIAGFAGISIDRVKSGYFDNARWYAFACNWNFPVVDYEPIASGFLGKATIRDDKYVIEEMSLIDVLNQQVGRIISAQCDKVFGSTGWNGCKKTPVVVAGTIETIANLRTYRDSTITNADDFFAEGTVEFTSGANAGLRSIVIRNSASDGTFTLHEQPFYTVKVGDAFKLTEGCRKRQADCIDKGNILNYGGFPSVPPGSVYTDRGLK